MLRIAQDLDADYVIFGSFSSDGTSLSVESHLLRVDPPALLAPVSETGPLELLDGLAGERCLAYAVRQRQNVSARSALNFRNARARFASTPLSISFAACSPTKTSLAFASCAKPRASMPAWPDPAFALGETYAGSRRLPFRASLVRSCAQNTSPLRRSDLRHRRLPSSAQSARQSRRSLHLAAGFALRNNSDRGPPGERLSGADLPEILNNLGARARSPGQDPRGSSRSSARQSNSIPTKTTIPSTSACSRFAPTISTAAATSFREAVEREPDNAEDRALADSIARESRQQGRGRRRAQRRRRGSRPERTADSSRRCEERCAIASRSRQDRSRHHRAAPGNSVLVKRVDFRIGLLRWSCFATPAAHIRQGRQELAAGRLELAEAQFRAALAYDPANASAHRGLAEVDRRRNKFDDAVQNSRPRLQAATPPSFAPRLPASTSSKRNSTWPAPKPSAPWPSLRTTPTPNNSSTTSKIPNQSEVPNDSRQRPPNVERLRGCSGDFTSPFSLLRVPLRPLLLFVSLHLSLRGRRRTTRQPPPSST